MTRVKLSRQGMEPARAILRRAKKGPPPDRAPARRAAATAQFVRCDPVTPVGSFMRGRSSSSEGEEKGRTNAEGYNGDGDGPSHPLGSFPACPLPRSGELHARRPRSRGRR